MSKHTSGPVAKSSSERFMGDSSQGQKAGVPSGLPSHTGVSSAQFKNIDTPEAVVPGNRQADRVLHRTGTNTRIGSMGPGGAVNMSGGWGAAQQGQAGNGGASIGKYPPGAPGADMGDRALSMARMGNKGAAKDLAGGLQAGDVSFTLQKKVSTRRLWDESRWAWCRLAFAAGLRGCPRKRWLRNASALPGICGCSPRRLGF